MVEVLSAATETQLSGCRDEVCGQEDEYLETRASTHEDIARMQIRVHEVVDEEHLQVGIHTQAHNLQPRCTGASQ